MAGAQLLVERLGERLEVDIGGVHEGVKFLLRRRVNAARSRVLARFDPIGRTSEGQSSKVRRGPSPATSISVNFLFWRTFCSGAALVPGAHLFPSPHGIVAVIGDENAGRAPANPQTDGAAYARASPFHTNYFP